MNVFVLVADLERLAVVSLPMANVARHVDVGQEMHLDLDETIALARLATAALHVERETARSITALARFLYLREQFADRREQSRVGCRIRTRRTADRTLIDADNLVEVLEAFNLRIRRRLLGAIVQMPRHRVINSVIDQRRFAGARHAGYANE